ncbi:MAG: type II toxin-antitoxin system VapC family toxin [Anaerolineales bacterium]|nr:type II toxin-antitoxin system VapC family toxin [Anaerolineales bacterium]
MTYLLDTNVCIRYLNGRSNAVVERLQSLTPTEVAVCAIVKAELFYGAHRSNNPVYSLARQQVFLRPLVSYPFDDKAAFHAGQIRAELARQGMPIGPNDLLIAATARANGLTLVTHNTREFERIPGLAVEDWEN